MGKEVALYSQGNSLTESLRLLKSKGGKKRGGGGGSRGLVDSRFVPNCTKKKICCYLHVKREVLATLS